MSPLLFLFAEHSLIEGQMTHTPVLPWLPDNAPGQNLTLHPGKLSLGMLLEGCAYATTKLVVERTWTHTEVDAYFNLLCINKSTTAHFTMCCRNHLLSFDMNANPQSCIDRQSSVLFVQTDMQQSPAMYEVPLPPAAWNIGTLDQ